MTDQPKPRLRGPLNPAEYQGLTYLSDASSRIALDLNSDLLNALAEVERLKADNTELCESLREAANLIDPRVRDELDALKAKSSFMEDQFKAEAMRNGENVIDRDKATHHAGIWLNATADARTEIIALKAQLATTSKGSMTVERMQEKLAESDARIIANSERYAADREIWRGMLFAAEAENLKLRDVLEDVREFICFSELKDAELLTEVERLISSPPSELTAALGELVETCAQLIKARINMRDLSGPVHRVSLAHEGVQAALEGKV